MAGCAYRLLATAAMAISAITMGNGAAAQEAAKPAPAPSVSVTQVVEKDIRPTISFTGRIQAVDKVELRARVDGFLEKRLFTEGQDVKEGDLLFVMEKGQYEAAVVQAQGAIESAEAALALTNIEVERQTTLVAKSAAPQSQLDLAIAKQSESKGSLTQLNAALDKAKLDLGYTEIRTPDCRTHRPFGLFRRKFHRPLEQCAGDDRQPGSDLRELFGVAA
jgi:membrane fusion protein (multidrug efflux system)